MGVTNLNAPNIQCRQLCRNLSRTYEIQVAAFITTRSAFFFVSFLSFFFFDLLFCLQYVRLDMTVSRNDLKCQSKSSESKQTVQFSIVLHKDSRSPQLRSWNQQSFIFLFLKIAH